MEFSLRVSATEPGNRVRLCYQRTVAHMYTYTPGKPTIQARQTSACGEIFRFSSERDLAMEGVSYLVLQPKVLLERTRYHIYISAFAAVTAVERHLLAMAVRIEQWVAMTETRELHPRISSDAPTRTLAGSPNGKTHPHPAAARVTSINHHT